MSISCSPEPSHPDPEQLAVEFAVITNLTGEDYFEAEFRLKNHSAVALENRGWALYFNFARVIRTESAPSSVAITSINGDFYKMEPTDAFEPLAAGEERTIPFQARNWVVKEAEAPSGLYFVFSSSEAGEAGQPKPYPVTDYRIAPFERPEQTSRGAEDRVPVPTARSRFDQNAKLSEIPEEEIPRIIPTPVSVNRRKGSLVIRHTTEIRYEGPLEGEARYLQQALEPLLGARLAVVADGRAAPHVIMLRLGNIKIGRKMKRSGDEAYSLWVAASRGIEIVGTDRPGVLYGIQSLRAWLPPQVYASPRSEIEIPEVLIEDFPRFAYRGMHLDVARNFQPAAEVEKFLELMAFYKLNRFHFHLTDDEGWRVEIEELPELTSVGARRGHTEEETDRLVPSFGSGPEPDRPPGSGYYSRAEFIRILEKATALQIEVIPEIDVPGHTRAAIRAMEARAAGPNGDSSYLLSEAGDRSTYTSIQGWRDNVINVCQDSTYRFLETVVDDLIEMYDEADAPLRLVHTGGDEVPEGVWEGSPACQALMAAEGIEGPRGLANYFLDRMSEILFERGLKLAGWEEVALTGTTHDAVKEPNPEFIDRGFIAYVWNSVWGWGGEQNAYKLANSGYPVVLCNVSNLYFDLSYNKHPEETGYYWGGFVDTRKPWEFTPLDIYRGAEENLFGHPIDPASFEGLTALTGEGAKNILGIQGQLWAENAKSPEILEYLAFPKLLGLAERAWAAQPGWATVEDPLQRKAEREAAWNVFAHTLGTRELDRLDHLEGGVHFRIPPPGARVRDATLEANVAFPGLAIRYTTDGSEPTPSSTLYQGPAPVIGEVRLRAFSIKGRGSRTVSLSAE